MLDDCTRAPDRGRAARTIDARHQSPAVALAAAALFAGTIATETPAQVASVNGQIAYVARDSFTRLCDIWVMNADGTGRQAVTTTNAWPYGSRPTWSPGGTQVALTATPKKGSVFAG